MVAFLRIILLSVLVMSCAAAPRRKEIDLEKLEKDFFEESEETDDWHEDGIAYEDRREEKLLQSKSIFERINHRNGRGDATKKGQIQGTFVYSKDKTCTHEMCAIDIAQKFVSLLQTGGVTVSAYPVDNDQLLFTNADGKWHQMKEFLLEQSEVKRIHWAGKDFWAHGVKPDPTNAGDSLIPAHLKVQDREEVTQSQMKALGMEQDETGAWVKKKADERNGEATRKKSKKRDKKKRKRNFKSH